MILWEQAAKAFEVGLHTDNVFYQFLQIKLFSFELSAKRCCFFNYFARHSQNHFNQFRKWGPV